MQHPHSRLYKVKKQFQCAGAIDGLYPVREGECSAFYISCQNGVRRDMPCPQGLVYNAKEKGCDHAVNCQKQVKTRKPGEGLTVIDQGGQQSHQQQGSSPSGGYNPRHTGA